MNIDWMRNSTWALGLLFSLLTGVTFIYDLSQWHADWLLAQQPVKSLVLEENELESVSKKIAALSQADLFGKSADQVPITQLQLEVTGIVKVESEAGGRFSKAYISVSQQPSKIYRIGDSLPDGVKIYDITSDAVILENGGRLEKLPLAREKLEFRAAPNKDAF